MPAPACTQIMVAVSCVCFDLTTNDGCGRCVLALCHQMFKLWFVPCFLCFCFFVAKLFVDAAACRVTAREHDCSCTVFKSSNPSFSPALSSIAPICVETQNLVCQRVHLDTHARLQTKLHTSIG